MHIPDTLPGGRSRPTIPCGKANGASFRRWDPAEWRGRHRSHRPALRGNAPAHLEEHQRAAGSFLDVEDEVRAATPSEREIRREPRRMLCSAPTVRMDGERVIGHLEAAPKPAFPRRDRCAGSDPRGRGRGCANAHGLEPVAVPRTAGSLPAPPERALQPRPARTARRKTFACNSIRRIAGAHVQSDGVRIGTPCRLRGRVRP